MDKFNELTTGAKLVLGATIAFLIARYGARRRIMRRLLRDIAEGKAIGDTTTLADPNVIARLKEQYEDEH